MTTLAEVNATLGVTNIALSGVAKEQKETNKGISNTYVIGSGKGNSIKTVIEIIFDNFDLNFDKYVDVDETLIRKGDPVSIISNPKKINNELSWSNNVSFEDLIQICIESKINKF